MYGEHCTAAPISPLAWQGFLRGDTFPLEAFRFANVFIFVSPAALQKGRISSTLGTDRRQARTTQQKGREVEDNDDFQIMGPAGMLSRWLIILPAGCCGR